MKGKRIFLVGGPGGVGKTTLSAALATHLAEAGHRTAILTVDPAKRLAQAMGLENLGQDLQEVPLRGAKAGGTLHASMLDSGRYFDKLISRFAKSEEQKERVLNNPLYRIMIEHLGGSHEYAAMERLLEFSQDDRFDKIVIDTPPTQNALELLNAPQRLADFMDGSVLKWFQGGQKLYLQFFRSGTRIAMKILNHVFGSDFLQAIEGFFDAFEGMQTGFRARHLEVLEVLKAPSTSFWLVTDAAESRLHESLAFHADLKERSIQLDRVIINRVEFLNAPKPDSVSGNLKSRLGPVLQYAQKISIEQNRWVRDFEQKFRPIPVLKVERFESPPHDTVALSKIGQFLVS